MVQLECHLRTLRIALAQERGRGERELKVRVKTARGRKLSSTRWLERSAGRGSVAAAEAAAMASGRALLHDHPERLPEMISNLPFSTILVVPEWNGLQTVNTRVRDLSGNQLVTKKWSFRVR